MAHINNPHDQFFKTILSNVESARVYLEAFLPKNVVELLDFSTLRITDHSFLTEELSAHFADLVFECALTNIDTDDKQIWISILFEHKSWPEKYTLL